MQPPASSRPAGDLLERVRSHVLFDNHDPAILENLLSLATGYSRKGAEKKHFDYNLSFNRILISKTRPD